MEKKLYNGFAKLEEQKAKLLGIFQRWDLQQLHFKPMADHWSLTQVLDHIIKVDRSITNNLLKYQDKMSKEKLGLTASGRALFLKLFLLTPVKLKAPNIPGLQPGESIDLQSVIAGWNESRSLLKSYLEVFPQDKLDNFVFKHPLIGKLNAAQTLMFIYYHTRHHEYQVKRITSHRNFPEEIVNE